MTKVSYINISSGLEDLYFKNVKQSDRFVHSHVSQNRPFVSRKKKLILKDRSLMSLISNLWKSFDSSTIENWNTCGSLNNLSGFQLFMRDHSSRVKAGLTGVATPSLLHQAKVGQIEITSDSVYFKITQKHPHNYWTLSKTLNKKSMFSPVFLSEVFSLPLTFGLNYSSSLEVSGSNPSLKFFVTVRSSYQGVDRYTDFAIDLDFSSNWVNIESVIETTLGQIISYDVSFEIKDLKGFLFFDNIKIYHSGQNWARDFSCENIEKKHYFPFDKIIDSWVDVNVPTGSSYCSVYKDF
jgi:hypothetical protein